MKRVSSNRISSKKNNRLFKVIKTHLLNLKLKSMIKALKFKLLNKLKLKLNLQQMTRLIWTKYKN